MERVLVLIGLALAVVLLVVVVAALVVGGDADDRATEMLRRRGDRGREPGPRGPRGPGQ